MLPATRPIAPEAIEPQGNPLRDLWPLRVSIASARRAFRLANQSLTTYWQVADKSKSKSFVQAMKTACLMRPLRPSFRGAISRYENCLRRQPK